jgi:hypothetical protein
MSDGDNEVCRSLDRLMWAGVVQKGFIGFSLGRTFIEGKNILDRETKDTEVRMSIICWTVGTN